MFKIIYGILRKKRYKHILKFIKGESVLEIGSTDNYLKKLMPSKKITCADINPKQGVKKENIENLTFKDNSFDTVLCMEVLEHVSDPVKAGIVKSWKSSGNNVTGVSSGIVTDKQLEYMVKFHPSIKRVLVISKKGDQSSEAGLNKIIQNGKNDVDVLLKMLNVFQGMHYIEYMRRSHSQEKFARGWFKRVNFVKEV